MSRWTPAIVFACLIAACSDSRSVTAPAVPATISAEVATSTAACHEEFDALRAAIAAATFAGKGATAANLVIKVNDAEAKLAEGKTADALQKLADVRASVAALSTPDAKGKIKLTAGKAAIDTALTNAEACINQVVATASA